MKPKLILCFALVLSGPAVHADEEYAIKVRPIGLQIVSPNFETNRPKPFSVEEKMVISLLVESEVTPLVTIESQASFMEQLSDDKGAPWKKPLGTFDWSPTISSNGHAALVTFNSASPPQRDAKAINATGKLKIVFGKVKDSFEITNTTLTPKSLSVPGHKFTIARVREQMGFVGDNFRAGPVPVNNVTFRLEGDSGRWVESIVLFDNTGNSITARPNAARISSSSSEWEYNVPKGVEAASIRITVWTKHETQLVPFNFTTGIGL